MATAFEIKGKTEIYSDAGGASTLVGQSDADDVPEWEEVIGERVIHTNGSGPEVPAKIIHLGRRAIVRANLIEFDYAEIDNMLVSPGGTDRGDIGTLGSDRTFFELIIQGSITGARKYTFPKARLIEQPREHQWGLMESKINLVFECIPDPSALQTATTAIFTVGSV